MGTRKISNLHASPEESPQLHGTEVRPYSAAARPVARRAPPLAAKLAAISGDVLLPVAMRGCELCQLARTTRWYAEFTEPFRFAVLDCDSCEVPMAVLGAHRAAPSPEERAVMQAALGRIADEKYPQGWFFDDHMRQIPEHYHLHARPYPAWAVRR